MAMDSLLQLPFFEQLKDAQNILIAGCGGGYDIFSGIPLYFALKARGKTVSLSNLSFTPQVETIQSAEKIAPFCVAVTADSYFRGGDRGYFPEANLSQWFRNSEKEEVPIYTIDRSAGVKPSRKIYQTLAEKLSLDAIVLVDGGTDSVMRGDEDGNGSPEEDMTSIVALKKVKVKTKLLACLGFGVDCFHGVSHGRFLENVADLTRAGAFFGVLQLLPTMKEAQKFKEAYEACTPENSIVCSSVLSAVEGKFGNHHSPHTASRTKGSELFISAIMSQFWFFDYSAILANIIYKGLSKTETHNEVRKVIFDHEKQFRDAKGGYTGKRGKLPIPY